MAGIYPRFSFWVEHWGERASRRVCRELWGINWPSTEALTVTARRSQCWMQLGELECVAIVWTMCGAQSLLCKSAKSHAFHCLPWVAIKQRGRTLFLSKSKVNRQKGQNIQSHKNINTLDRKIPPISLWRPQTPYLCEFTKWSQTVPVATLAKPRPGSFSSPQSLKRSESLPGANVLA